MPTKRELTPSQERAVEALNQALTQARRAHLVICGMENRLLVYNGTSFDHLDATGKFESAYEIQRELGQGIALDAHGV
jgi:hypothetical protein